MTLMAQRRLIETMAVKRTPEIANITTNYRAYMKKYIVVMHPQRIKCNKDFMSEKRIIATKYIRDINIRKSSEYVLLQLCSRHLTKNRRSPTNGKFLLNTSVIHICIYFYGQRICSVVYGLCAHTLHKS